MAKPNQDTPQFGTAQPPNMGGSAHCTQTEALLTDALDGTLSSEEQAQFDLHLTGCVACQQMVADAQRGAAFLELLRSPRPEPPASLLDRILAQTAGQTSAQAGAQGFGLALAPAAGVSLVSGAMLPLPRATVLPFPRRMVGGLNFRSFGHAVLQPRLAMTAAMAFFSIGLTLNLTGIRLNELHASDLRPSSMRRGISEANVRVVRYVDNLRVVYELESRVRDLQRSSDTEEKLPPSDDAKPSPNADPNADPKPKQSRPRSGSGSSSRSREPLAPITMAFAPANILHEGETV